MGDHQVPKLKTVYWAIKLLECFDEDHGRRSVTELSEMMSIPKSSICNALSTFEQLGYIRKHGATGKYSLGPKVLCLYHAYSSTNSDAFYFQRECKNLGDRINAIVHVAVRVDDRLVCLVSSFPARYAQPTPVGSEFSFHSTAIGKSILSFLDGKQQNRILAKGLQPYTQNTITDMEQMMTELELTRRRGYAVDNSENEEGMCSVAVPIWRSETHSQAPKYSMSITVPAQRLTDDQVLEYVKIIRDSEKEIFNMVSSIKRG